MRKNYFKLLFAFLIFSTLHTECFGQAVGDYGSTTSGTWSTASTWVICATAGQWTDATAAGSAPSASVNVWIRPGHTVTISSTGAKAINVTVMSGGTLIQSQGGNLTATGALTLQANAYFTQNGTSQTLPGATKSFDNASTVEYNGSMSNVTYVPYGNLTYISSSVCGITSGNTLTVNGNLYIHGAKGIRGNSGTSGSNTHTIGGNVTIDVSGAYLTGNNGTGSENCTWNIGGNVTLTNGARIVLYESGGPHTGASTVTIGGNLSIDATSSINLRSSSTANTSSLTGTINVKGNVTNSNSNGITTVSGTSSGTAQLNINLNGTSAQQWTGAFPTTNLSSSGAACNITMNNAAGLTMNSAVTLNGTLTLTSGNITTTNTNYINVATTGIISGGSSSSFINGPLQHTIASTSPTSKTFPLGKGSFYAPVVLNITQSAATSTNYKAEVFASGIPSKTFPGTIGGVSTSRYYNLSVSSANIANGSIGLVYDANDASIATGTAANMRIVGDQGGSSWVDLGPTAGGASPVTSDVNFTALGNFAIANKNTGTPPTLTTEAVSAIDATTATGNGTITADGSSDIAASGVCWSTSSGAETVSGSHSSDGPTGATTGAYTSSMTGLAAGQTYYVKAYATNATVTGYGSEVTLKTKASVTTASVTSLLQNTATCGGTVTSAGSYTEKGICWSTSSNPTTADSHTTNGTGSGNGTYSNDISGLSSNTDYHVRAYVTNESGTYYGADVPFKTLAEVPTIAVSKSSLTDFGSVTANKTSSTQTYTVSGSFLTSSITITPPAGFQISNDGGSTWVSNPNTIVLTQTGGSLDNQPVTITAKFNPNAASSYSSNIVHTATDATTQNVAVSGTGIAVTNPTALTVSKKSDNIAYLTWTAPTGSYDKVLVFAQVATDVTISPSGVGSVYSGDNLAWGSAITYGAGSDKLVYAGTGTSAEVTGLTNDQTYYFKVYSYSGDSYGATPASANFTTTVQPTTTLAGTVANAQSVLTWTNPTYNVTQGNYWDEVIVLAKSGGIVDATPTGDGTSYTANATFGSGTQLGSGNYVVYKGTGTTQTVTGLTNFTTYYYATFVRHGSLWSASNTANATPTPYTVGDYGSVASGTWATYATTWKRWDGSGWNTTATAVPTSSNNVWIVGGFTVTVGAAGACKDLHVVNGTLKTNTVCNGTNTTAGIITVSGTTVEVTTGGTVGNGLDDDSADAISFQLNNAGTTTISGNGGTIDVSKFILGTASATVVVDHDIKIHYHGSGFAGNAFGLFANAAGQTLTINTGKTVTLAKWSSLGNTGTSHSYPATNFTVNVNGTLTLQAGKPTGNSQTWAWAGSGTSGNAYLVCNAGSSNLFTLTIGSSGIVNVPEFYPNGTISAGTAGTGSVSSISIAAGGSLNVGVIADFRNASQTITGGGAFTLASGATLKTGNSSGIDGSIATTGTKTLDAAANYLFNGSSAQVTGTSLSNANNVEINNTSGVTLSGNTTINGTLTLASGTLSQGSYTLTLGSNATVNKTSGSLSGIPTFPSVLNLTYSGSATTGNELPATDIVNSLTVNNSAGITLTNNYTISTLSIGSGASLTIPAGKQLTVSGILSNSGTLNLNSDASGTATILTPAGNAGTASVQQYLPQGRNWYISSPVLAADASAISGANLGSSVVYYDEANSAWTPTTGALTPGLGYISVATAGSATSNAVFNGTLNNGDISVVLTRKGTSKAGFNLVANPYASYMDGMAAVSANTNLEQTIWYRTKVSGTYYFETVNTASGIGSSPVEGSVVSRLIPPMQAFWVRTLTDNNAMTFTNAMRYHANPTIGGSTVNTTVMKAPKQPYNQLIRLRVSNGVNSDETVIYSNENASNGYDVYDSQKMLNNGNTIPDLYTTCSDNKLVINGMNAIPMETEIPIGFTPGSAGVFSITASELSNFDSSVELYLKDARDNSYNKLAIGDSYNLSSDNTTSASRFSLVLKAKSVTTGLNNQNNTKILVHGNGSQQLVVNCPENQIGKSKISIFNAIGQLIRQQILSTTNMQISLPAGVYTVNAGGVISKVIIK